MFVGAGCGAPSKASPGPAPRTATEPLITDNESEKLDLATIFPPGPGRDLVLENCQSCHTIVPIVVLQMDENRWRISSMSHRERVENVTDEQFTLMYEYLPKHFGPHRPVPRLPKRLLDTWTSY